LKQETAAARKPSPPPSLELQSSDPQPYRKAGEQPNLDSDDENDASPAPISRTDSSREALAELDSNSTAIDTTIPVGAVSNKAFTCCIKQYGAVVKEDNPSKANAGKGKKWKRMFGLYGTQIL
jgi:protection of telomeres protein 1